MRKIKDERKYERMTKTIAQRFESYGYVKTNIPAFESYDVYATIDRAINVKEMVKVIDYTGEVLVLRPDVTIPLTKQMIREKETNGQLAETRRYYVQEVFRQPFTKDGRIERLQMGIECFEQSTPERDAEMIALASHALHDLHIDEHTVEIGYASFLNDLLADYSLDDVTYDKIERYIQAKNSAELEAYVTPLPLPQQVKEVLTQIPTLYGNLQQIERRLSQYTTESAVDKTLQKMKELYRHIEAFGLAEQVVFDFGLVNTMGYYSDLLFQVYVDGTGRPVLMGGRYDELSERLDGQLEAIGFAFDLDVLSEVVPFTKDDDDQVDVHIYYVPSRSKEAIELATELRNRRYETTMSRQEERNEKLRQMTITFEEDVTVETLETKRTVTTIDEILRMMKRK